MKTIVSLIAAATAVTGIVSGCNYEKFSALPEQTQQQTQQPTVVNGSFSYKMNSLMPTDENYMFSPLSIKAALVLAANGADGKTLEEIEAVLESGDIDTLNKDIQALTKRYESLENTEIKIADSLWLNTDIAGDINFNKTYADNIKKYFGAEPEKVNTANAADKINNWCSDNTNGKITKIIDDSDFIAALVNSVYFNGEWEYPFKSDATEKSTFTDRYGKQTEIDFMNKTHKFNFYKDKDIKILELPYSDGQTAMYAYLTDDKRIDITNYFDRLQSADVIVSMPKFKTEYSRTLNEDLKALGIKAAFEPDNAQFDKMFENQAEGSVFWIDKVLHKTFIEVDEKGTEAAAVTAVTMKTNSIAVAEKPEFEEFIADKPFGYCIADRETHEILFMGEFAFAE